MKIDMTAKDQTNYQKFALLMLAWIGAFIAATISLRGGWISSQALQIIVALIPSVLLATTIVAYIRFLRVADEMIRKIHVEALGWGFGAGILFTMGYRLLQRIDIVPDLDINDPVIVMMLFWSLGLWRGVRRYAS